jgi:hypothetical protein
MDGQIHGELVSGYGQSQCGRISKGEVLERPEFVQPDPSQMKSRYAIETEVHGTQGRELLQGGAARGNQCQEQKGETDGGTERAKHNVLRARGPQSQTQAPSPI